MSGPSQRTEGYFRRRFGVSLDALLAPIDAQRPAGSSLRGNGVYSAIKEARRQDDETLPLGPWAFELKRADWSKVGSIAVEALAAKSKDLQLAAWLLESQIHLTGFDGIGACVALMQGLCERYWQELEPPIDGGDFEYRANIIAWMDEKLLPAVRLAPITALGRGPREYAWADWEQAKRNEQIRAAQGARPDQPLEGASLQELATATAGTSTEAHLAVHASLGDALQSIDAFNRTLDELCGREAPALGRLGALLEQIQLVAASELHKRGAATTSAGDAAEAADGAGGAGGSGSGGGGAGGDGGGDSGPIRDRAHAYARLAQAADYLAHTEPHSPAPCLVQRAIHWGNLNTAELYHELFVKLGGQLSIFELLGLKSDSNPAEDKK